MLLKRASINRPIAGPTHERVLPRGHRGAEYDAWLIRSGCLSPALSCQPRHDASDFDTRTQDKLPSGNGDTDKP